jgi:hypothetical protein
MLPVAMNSRTPSGKNESKYFDRNFVRQQKDEVRRCCGGWYSTVHVP